MANVDYKQCIKEIVSETTDMALTKNGIDIVNKLIDSLNSRLISYCLELESTVDEIDVLTARNIAGDLFTGDLKRVALAEGNKTLMLYKNGLIEYKPYYPDVVKRKKKTKKTMSVEAFDFTDGISDLTSSMFPDASLQDQAKRVLSELLEELAMKISDFVQSKKSNSITLENIRAALRQLLPPELSKCAIGEGARIVTLFETGMLQEIDRKRTPVKARPKRVPIRKVEGKPKRIPAKEVKAKSKRVVTRKVKAPSISRKRKRSPSIETPPSPKRRKMPSARKVYKKKTIREISQRRTKPKVSRRPVSRKRARSRKVERKMTLKKRVPSKPASKKPTRPKVSRKKRVQRRATRKVSKTKKAPSRKKRIPSKKRTAVRKGPTRVPPKTIRRISKKKPTKKKLVSGKKVLWRIAATTKEISRGTRKLNESFQQKLPTESLRLAAEFISNLLDRLVEEMGKLKSSVIGPAEVRRAAIKVFPPNLAQLAIAHMSQVLMT